MNEANGYGSAMAVWFFGGIMIFLFVGVAIDYIRSIIAGHDDD